MSDDKRRVHWDAAYASKGEAGVSWFEDKPEVSLNLIRRYGQGSPRSLIDIGGGASRLVDRLLEEGGWSVAVLDLSSTALGAARARLGARGGAVEWIVADVTDWSPSRQYDIWHDRAAFHFLTSAAERAAYVERLRASVMPSGHAIIATFAPDGPERCSGLPVMRYDAATLAEIIGPSFQPVAERRHVHITPSGSEQAFQFSVLKRVQP